MNLFHIAIDTVALLWSIYFLSGFRYKICHPTSPRVSFLESYTEDSTAKEQSEKLYRVSFWKKMQKQLTPSKHCTHHEDYNLTSTTTTTTTSTTQQQHILFPCCSNRGIYCLLYMHHHPHSPQLTMICIRMCCCRNGKHLHCYLLHWHTHSMIIIMMKIIIIIINNNNMKMNTILIPWPLLS